MAGTNSLRIEASDLPKQRGLPELVQSLPQELFENIYDLTFTAQPEGIRHVSFHDSEGEGQGTHHASIRLLQVDHASRAKFARSYYGSGKFVLADWDRDHHDHHGRAWLQSLSRADFRLLKKFEYVVDMHPADPVGHSELQRARRRYDLFKDLVHEILPKQPFRKDCDAGKLQVMFYDEQSSTVWNLLPAGEW